MANAYNAEGNLIVGEPVTLDSLKGLAAKLDRLADEMRALMSGRDDREATTERQRRKREDAEEKARARDAEREAEEDQRSLSPFAKRRIAGLEKEIEQLNDVIARERSNFRCEVAEMKDDGDIYRGRLEAIAITLGCLQTDIKYCLDRHQENPNGK